MCDIETDMRHTVFRFILLQLYYQYTIVNSMQTFGNRRSRLCYFTSLLIRFVHMLDGDSSLIYAILHTGNSFPGKTSCSENAASGAY